MADENMKDVPGATGDEIAAQAQDVAASTAEQAGGLLDKVKDLAGTAGGKLGEVASSVGGVVAPAAQTVAGTVAGAVSTAAQKVGEGVSNLLPSNSAEHSGGVPESGASARTDNVQNLPGQSVASREVM